ncbi:MAG: hypothetical protein JOY91_01480, partial [Sinobacteraceae bacterium]|nr:hypothetical protein [Nevskiaceae bacterium]
LVLVAAPGEVVPPSGQEPFEGHPRCADRVRCWQTDIDGTAVDVWLLVMSPRPPGTRIAVVRSLCRIIGWLQEVAILSRVASDQRSLAPFHLDRTLCERFARTRTGRLRKRIFDNWPVAPILARVNEQTINSEQKLRAFAAAMGPLLPRDAGNDLYATLRRIGAHHDAVASVVVNQGVVNMARDTYNVERAGAVGPHATASHVTFNEGASELASQTDLKVLAVQLDQLRVELLKAARDASHYEAVAAVAKAEEATKKGETASVFSNLKDAGEWALDMASKIGASVAAKAIEGAMGL